MSTVLPNHVLRLMSPEDRAKLGPAGQLASEAIAKHETRLEKELQQQIGQYLRLLGVWFDQDSMAHRRRGTKGAPDFIFAYRGIPCAVEAKTETGAVHPEQAQAHDAMRKNGWVVIIARSLVDVQGLLRAIDKEQRTA